MSTFRELRPFLLLCCVLLAAALALELVNDRFWLNDLRVYYMAADALVHGTPVYGVAFGEDTGLYKYAPSVLYLFLPYTLLPFRIAAFVHFLLMGVALLAIFISAERILSRQLGVHLSKAALRSILGLLCIVVLLIRELHLGNINLGLLLLVLLATERLLQVRSLVAGLLLGIAFFVKPYLLLLSVPLIIRGDRRAWIGAAASIGGALMLPLIYPGPSGWWTLHQQWIGSMVGHSAILESPDTFRYMLINLSGQVLPQTVTLGFIAVAGLTLAIWTRSNIRHEHPVGEAAMDRCMELWTALAVVPNLVVTDQEHFLFTLPLILFVLAYLFAQRDRHVLLLFISGLMLYATRSSDLWGAAFEDRLVWWGVLGSGNIVLIATALVAWRRWRKIGRHIADRPVE